MALSIIRKATQEDRIQLEQSAQRFCKRHNIDTEFCNSALSAIENQIDYSDDNYLTNLWKRCASRALKLPEKGDTPIIAHGYVGVSVN